MPEDSVAVERLLHDASSSVPDSSRVLFFAEALCGVPYVANTLERDGEEESLVVCLSGFDCMTFVETVLALAETSRAGSCSFHDFAANLRRIRYRGGVVDGYCSRLHYFTEWAAQNLVSHAGWEEATTSLGVPWECASRKLDFMSSHARLYPRLRDDNANLCKTHVGFVVVKEGKACLLHASSRHKKVLVEPASLKDYLSGQPSVSGMRVFRFRFR